MAGAVARAECRAAAGVEAEGRDEVVGGLARAYAGAEAGSRLGRERREQMWRWQRKFAGDWGEGMQFVAMGGSCGPRSDGRGALASGGGRGMCARAVTQILREQIREGRNREGKERKKKRKNIRALWTLH